MSNAEVALVGEGGQPLGSKPRNAITATDTYHSVFVLVMTPTKELLLRKLGSGKLSATGMVICRAGEDPTEAARRAAPWISTFHHLGDQMYALPMQKIYASVYYAIAANPDDTAYVALPTDSLTNKPLTPALALIWDRFKHLLPASR